MLKPKKRLTKKQIKQDKFVTYYFKAQDFVNANSRYLIAGLIAVVLVVVVSLYFSGKKAEQEQNALVELSKARIEYFAGNYPGAIDILNKLIQNFRGTETAKEGTYFFASCQFFLKNYDIAEEYFQIYLDKGDDEVLAASALAGIAACHEEQGEYSQAAKRYQEAASKYSDGFMAPSNLYNSARCFSLAREKEKAIKVLRLLIDKYETAQIKNDAEILLGELDS